MEFVVFKAEIENYIEMQEELILQLRSKLNDPKFKGEREKIELEINIRQELVIGFRTRFEAIAKLNIHIKLEENKKKINELEKKNRELENTVIELEKRLNKRYTIILKEPMENLKQFCCKLDIQEKGFMVEYVVKSGCWHKFFEFLGLAKPKIYNLIVPYSNISKITPA